MSIDILSRSDLDRLIRYGYSGFLFVGILLFVMPARVKPIIQAGGAVVSPLAVLAAGAAIYTLYRYVLNELFLSPLVLHPIHSWLDRRREEVTNPANYLAKYAVPWHLRHPAYVELRRGFFDQEQRRMFDRNHTEAAVVWLTAVESSFLGASLLVVDPPDLSAWKCWLLLGIGLLASAAAVLMDIRLFQQECRVLRTDDTRLRTFLESRGLISFVPSAAR